MAKLVLWLAVIAVVLLSFVAAARDLAETTQHTSESGNQFEDAKYGGGGYPGGGYGGYPGGGYGGGYPRGGGGYPGGGYGGYPGHGGYGGGYCRYGRCCGYYGRCRCCATAAEATAEASKATQPQN